jgi:hypothetical protein
MESSKSMGPDRVSLPSTRLDPHQAAQSDGTSGAEWLGTRGEATGARVSCDEADGDDGADALWRRQRRRRAKG